MVAFPTSHSDLSCRASALLTFRPGTLLRIEVIVLFAPSSISSRVIIVWDVARSLLEIGAFPPEITKSVPIRKFLVKKILVQMSDKQKWN